MISYGSRELHVRLNTQSPGTVSTIRAADTEPTPMYALRTALFSLFAVAVIGCGSSRPRADIDRGRQDVISVLDN